MILINGYAAFILFINENKRKEYFVTYLLGALFGLGLVVSGMCRVTKIQNFLILSDQKWDPSLIFVMMSAVAINVVTFHYTLSKL